MKKIYGLLVAVNDYPAPVPALRGCRYDLDQVKTYLENRKEGELHLQSLCDEAATKANIVAAFENHLAQAGAEDVVFFYFAGHGAQEAADPVFWPIEPNRRLQSILCYDSVPAGPGEAAHRPLADKELRYLIHRVARGGAHILTIFDCCHSGQVTRLVSHRARQYSPENSPTSVLPARPWSDFLFADALDPAALAETPFSFARIFPEGRHVQIAACLPREKAYETDAGGGVFTAALLDVLRRSSGKVTYYDLQSRVRNYLKNQFRQTPNIYFSPGAEGEAFRFFLDAAEGQGQPLTANVTHSPADGWWMDIGHLHGVSPLADRVRVHPLSAPEPEWAARIGRVEAGRTELLFDHSPPAEGGYLASIADFFSCPVKVHLKDETTDGAGSEALSKQLASAGRNLLPAAAEYQADYTVHVRPQGFRITEAEDERPVVRDVAGHSEASAQLIGHYLQHISRWMFVRQLHNPNTWRFRRHPVQVEFFLSGAGGAEQPLALQNEEVVIRPRGARAEMLSEKLYIKLTNTTEQPLYLAFLYLSVNFQVYAGMLRPPVAPLDPGRSIWVWDREAVELEIEPQVVTYNCPESITYFKLIASTEFFDVARLEQEPLPAPDAAPQRDSGRAALLEEENRDASGWTTRLITLRIANPEYR